MATTLTQLPKSEVAQATVSKTSTDDFTNEDFTVDGAQLIPHIAIEKPSGCLLNVDFVYPNGGATVRMIASSSSVTSADYLGKERVEVPDQTIIRVNSSGSASGTKKVTVFGRQVGA